MEKGAWTCFLAACAMSWNGAAVAAASWIACCAAAAEAEASLAIACCWLARW